MNIKLFKKGDLAVIIAVAVAAVVFAFFAKARTDKPVAVISVDGVEVEAVELYSLNERKEINLGGDYNIKIIAENGGIYFEHSDCPDKLCINAGVLRESGDLAVCLPAKTVITVEGTDVDAVVY
ncbi:MAG: NusG domain II-containing protein [Clostridia bacterium]|nr:NusG domain II-containing protein [Clostridia bacterium]